MKILYLIKGLGVGGAERHLLECATFMKSLNHDVKVCHFLPNKKNLESEFFSRGIEVYCLTGFLSFLAAMVKLLFLVRNYQPDIIHAHLPIPAIMARAVKIFTRTKVVTTEHNLFSRINPYVGFLYRKTNFLNDESISCSAAVRNSLPWPSIVVENGIDDPRENFFEKDKPLNRQFASLGKPVIFVCIANFHKKKNHFLLIEAFEKMLARKKDKSYALVVVGQGPEEKNIKRRIDASEFSNNIYLWGAHEKASDLLFDADVFCLSSDFEGLPLALLESMFVGLPAVVTNAGGMADVVEDGYSGYVVPVGDVCAYSLALDKVCESAEMRCLMGRRARIKAKSRYSLHSMGNRLLKVYEKVLDR